MDYCIVNADGIIENIIVADEAFATEIGALPSYDGAAIGAVYSPPEPELELTVWDELDAAYSEGYQEGVDNV